MNIDWTIVITHLLTLIIGGASGYTIKSIKVNRNTRNNTKGDYSPIFSNDGDVETGDFGVKYGNTKKSD